MTISPPQPAITASVDDECYPDIQTFEGVENMSGISQNHDQNYVKPKKGFKTLMTSLFRRKSRQANRLSSAGSLEDMESAPHAKIVLFGPSLQEFLESGSAGQEIVLSNQIEIDKINTDADMKTLVYREPQFACMEGSSVEDGLLLQYRCDLLIVDFCIDDDSVSVQNDSGEWRISFSFSSLRSGNIKIAFGDSQIWPKEKEYVFVCGADQKFEMQHGFEDAGDVDVVTVIFESSDSCLKLMLEASKEDAKKFKIKRECCSVG